MTNGISVSSQVEIVMGECDIIVLKADFKRTAAVAFGLALLAVAGLETGISYAAKTKITFMYWAGSPAHINAYNRIVKEFQKVNPDITVKQLAESWTGEAPYFQKYITMTTAGIAPDVIIVPFSWIPNFAESKLLEELSPYVAKSRLKLSSYSTAGIDASMWNGKLWGLNSCGSDFWVTYNKKIIAAAGLADPVKLVERGDWNWESIEEIAVKTSRFDARGKLMRIGLLQMADIPAMAPWIWGMGGNILSSDGTECKLGEPGAISGISKVWELLFKKKCMALAWSAPYNIDLSQASTKEQFAMAAWWNTVVTNLESWKVAWPFDTVPFPAGPKGSKNIVTTPHSVCVSRQSKQKNAAWELMKFVGSAKGQRILLEELSWLPTQQEVIKQYGDIMMDKGYSGGKFATLASERQRVMDRFSKWNLAMPKINSALSKIWGGKADVATTLTDVVKATALDLARGKKKK